MSIRDDIWILLSYDEIDEKEREGNVVCFSPLLPPTLITQHDTVTGSLVSESAKLFGSRRHIFFGDKLFQHKNSYLDTYIYI